MADLALAVPDTRSSRFALFRVSTIIHIVFCSVATMNLDFPSPLHGRRGVYYLLRYPGSEAIYSNMPEGDGFVHSYIWQLCLKGHKTCGCMRSRRFHYVTLLHARTGEFPDPFELELMELELMELLSSIFRVEVVVVSLERWNMCSHVHIF